MELARPQMKPSVAAKPRLKGVLLPPDPPAPASVSILSMSHGVSPADGYNKSINNNLYKGQNSLSKVSNSATCKLKPVTPAKFVLSETPSTHTKSISSFETQSASARAFSFEKKSANSRTLLFETQSANARAISFEKKSANSRAILFEKQPANTKSIPFETQSANAKSISFNTQSENAKATSCETQSSHAKSISSEAPSQTLEKTSVKPSEPPPLPPLPPPIQRKGPLSPSSSLSLPASFRSRNDAKSKLQTSPTIDSLTSSSGFSSIAPRSTKSLVRNVSPPSRPPPSVAPKPRHFTTLHKHGTASLPSTVSPHDNNTAPPLINDTHVNLPEKCVHAKPNTGSQKNNNPDISPSRHSVSYQRPFSQPPPPATCPGRLPGVTPSSILKTTQTTKPLGCCPSQDAQDTQAADGKSPAGKQSGAPPPLPKNPPLAGVPRKSNRCNIKSPTSGTKPGLEDSKQTPHSALSHSETGSSSEKVHNSDTSTQASTVSHIFNQSTSERFQVPLQKNEAVDTELPGSSKRSNFVNIFGTSLRPKHNNKKTTEDRINISKTSPYPKPTPRSSSALQSPVSASNNSTNFSNLNGNHINQHYTHQNSATPSIRSNNSIVQEPQLGYLEAYQATSGDDVSSYSTDKNLIFSPKKNASSLFGSESEETCDMLKEIEELLKNKLGDTQFNIENKVAVNAEVNHFHKNNSEQSSASAGKILHTENIPDINSSSSSSPSPARLRYLNNISTEVGILESLDTSISSSHFECFATACLSKTSGIIASTDKASPLKPKRTFIHRASYTSSDSADFKFEANKPGNRSSLEGQLEEVKPPYPESLRRSDSSDFCPPLPPRNKPRSTSLKEICGAPPLISKRSISVDTESSVKAQLFAAGEHKTSHSSQLALQPAESESKIVPRANQIRRSKMSREALPPPPPGPPKRSATFSPGDGKPTVADQRSAHPDTYNDQGTVSAPGSHVLKKSTSLLIHRQPNFEGISEGSHRTLNSARSRREDRPLSGVSHHSTGSEPQNLDEIVSSGTDTEPEQDEEEIYVQRKAKKVFFIAKEIVSSESKFVDVLRLLNLDFRVHISKSTEKLGHPVLPTETLNKILNFLPQLQNLNEELLKDLKERIDQWHRNPRLADIFVKKGPFLKLYSSYIRNFETACAILEDASKKNSAFAAVVKEFEMTPRCARLALKHYMLKPIQRIPQYKLLLQDYLKHLSEGSPDYKDTINALNIVSEVADHANDSMRYGDNIHKLLRVQRSLVGKFEVIQPGRVLVKQGELQKLSRKEMQPRMFFLFNDVLLYTTPASTGYKINNILPLIGMKINSPKLEDYKFEFNIISIQRSFTLCASSFEEKEQWFSALEASIEENAKKHHTFQPVKQGPQTSLQDKDFVLGHKAPLWVPDARVTMCMLCLLEFSLTLRRHHCRSCGRVVCFHCSENKAPLKYLKYDMARVCDNCFDRLKEEITIEFERSRRPKEELSQKEEDSATNMPDAAADSASSEKDREDGADAVNKHGSGLTLHNILGKFHKKLKKSNSDRRKPNNFRPSVLKEVRANDSGSDMCGYLHAYKSRKWKRLWFVVKGKVLYTYKASEDMAATESMPLLGYEVTLLNTCFEGCKPDQLFELSHQNNQPLTVLRDGVRADHRASICVEKTTPRLIFKTDTASALEKWVSVLREASLTYK